MENPTLRGSSVDSRLRAAPTPELYRVLQLRVVQGYTVDEVSRLLRVSPNTVLLRQHRAVQALRRSLDPGEEQRSTRH